MQTHDLAPNFLHKEKSKDNSIKPDFDASFIDEFNKEADTLLQQAEKENEIKTNKFPVEIFPSFFQELINECNKSLNFPIDYTGTAIIAAVSTAIGKSAKLKVKNNWYEFAAFYFGIIGNAGANKSHPLDLAFKPFEDIDRAIIKHFEQEFERYEAYQALNKKDKENQTKPDKPILKKSILHNFTPEILHQRLTDNERGCAVVSEELATWLEGMNNYSKGDQTSGYLSIWSNKATSIDRVSKAIPLWLPQPFLNIIGALQIRVLQRLFPSKKTDNGFLQRFLFALVEGAEKQPINDYEIDETQLIKYSKWIENYRSASPIYVDLETGKPKPKLYYWSHEAKSFFYKWQKENTDTVNENADTLIGEIFSKFDIHFCRLSLVLQIMYDYSISEISLIAVQAAEKLCSYYQRNAMKVLQILESGNPSDNLPQNKIALYNSLPDKLFTTSEANEIGEGLNFNVKAVQRFLNDESLFTWIAQGQYCKKAKSQLS
ncbi:MAG: YfjI family protein [Bacteroidota bacterium]|nr:YfjI family protein [Bacteroidota bacterium]